MYSIWIMHICDFAYCVLRIAYCVLRTAYCVLRTAYCVLRTAYCVLRTAYCVLRTAYTIGILRVKNDCIWLVPNVSEIINNCNMN